MTLPVSLLVPIAQMHAQTQVAVNAQTRAGFVQADTELNKTYEALLKKLPDGQSKEKLKQSQRHGWRFEMPRPRLRLIRRVAGQWLPQSATKPLIELTEQRIKQLKTRLRN